MTYNQRCRPWAGAIWVILWFWAPQLAAADVTAELDSLRIRGEWGELALTNGLVRQVQVDTIEGQQVMLQEVIGALHMRPATYALSDVRSVRPLGPRRIQARMAARPSAPSLPLTLGLELIIPGAGYFHAGEGDQGWRILLASLAIGATAVTMGENGAAVWIPLGTWLKLYSLHHLADEVRASQAQQARRSRLLSLTDSAPASTPTIMALRWQR